MPEEMRFVLRMALFSLFVGTLYWFLSYEWAGTILLVGLGIGSGVLLLLMWQQLRQRGRRLEGPAWRWLVTLGPADSPNTLTDEQARLPGSSLAPIAAGLAVTLAGLALIYGWWLLAAAILPGAYAVRAWLGEASAEYRGIEADDRLE